MSLDTEQYNPDASFLICFFFIKINFLRGKGEQLVMTFGAMNETLHSGTTTTATTITITVMIIIIVHSCLMSFVT